MAESSTRDDLLAAGLELVSERGLQTLFPDFTVRELIDRAGGPTRSAFQHAWPQRVDFERAVLVEVLADRAQIAPESVTSVPRALDLLESGPDLSQFTRHAYLNAGGAAQRRDLRDRIAVIRIATGKTAMAKFAAQSEVSRFAKADGQLVQVFRIAGMAFGLQPAQGFTFLDLAKIVGALMDGMLLQRIADPDATFNDYVHSATPGWSIESIVTDALVRQLTSPIGDEHTVPSPRKPHPSEASRPSSDLPSPQRPPTTQSLLLDAGVAIVKERGLRCGLPTFTIAEMLERVSSSVTEGAFHHSWPRKLDFEVELIGRLMCPDVARIESAADYISGLSTSPPLTPLEMMNEGAEEAMERPSDPTFMFLATLVEAGNGVDGISRQLSCAVEARIDSLESVLAGFAQSFDLTPKQPLTWGLIARIALAVTDGMLLRSMVDPTGNTPSQGHFGTSMKSSLLGQAYAAIMLNLVDGLTD